ncbi:MAG: ATP-binding protein [Pyrinomonadaceae bacterium]
MDFGLWTSMFDHLVGNQRAKETIRRMLRQRRVPGALLFVGEEAVGKKLFALEIAKALNCRAPREGGEACDACPSCARLSHFHTQGTNDAEQGPIIWSEHRDVGLVRPEKRFITVDQSRQLEREANFRPTEGAARVFIVEEADRLNQSSGNALLKTLEEMPATTYFILLTSRPASLLTTIRSRCQTIHFAPLSSADIESYLVREQKRAGQEARLVSRLARGRLGAALNINLDTYRAQREAMLAVLDALATTAGQPDRGRLLRAAEELTDPKLKDEYEARLSTLEILIHDAWLLSLDPQGAGVVNEDIRERLTKLATHLTSRDAINWLSHIEELRGQLAVNINRKIATDALFLSMAGSR